MQRRLSDWMDTLHAAWEVHAKAAQPLLDKGARAIRQQISDYRFWTTRGHGIRVQRLVESLHGKTTRSNSGRPWSRNVP